MLRAPQEIENVKAELTEAKQNWDSMQRSRHGITGALLAVMLSVSSRVCLMHSLIVCAGARMHQHPLLCVLR